MKTNYILTIAGNDVLSGGGFQADLATFNRSGLFGFVAQTCMTSIDASGFEIIEAPSWLFEKQLKSLSAVPFSAIKIGLLPSVEIADQTLAFIKKYSEIPIVLDPVLVFKENGDAATSLMKKRLLDLLPYVSITTPNLREAEILSDMTITTLSDMKKAAQVLYNKGAKFLVIKGGSRLDKHQAIDLFYDGKEMLELSSPVLHRNNNGAGCTFASSIASHLALGKTVKEAVKEAKTFVYHAIEQSNEYGVRQNYEKD